MRQGVYEIELTVTDDDGATGKDTIKVTVGASRVQETIYDMVILGNPVQTTLTAKITSGNTNRLTKIILFDARGTILFNHVLTLNQNIQLEQINMAGFSKGTYVLKAYFDNKTSVAKKVIKM